jgi:hypothetical protein
MGEGGFAFARPSASLRMGTKFPSLALKESLPNWFVYAFFQRMTLPCSHQVTADGRTVTLPLVFCAVTPPTRTVSLAEKVSLGAGETSMHSPSRYRKMGHEVLVITP